MAVSPGPETGERELPIISIIRDAKGYLRQIFKDTYAHVSDLSAGRPN